MTLPEFDGVQALGFLSFALGIACFYQRDDRRLKILLVIMNINNAIHFYFLNAMTAAAGAILAVLRTGVSLKTNSKQVAFFFIVVAFTWGVFLAEQWEDMFPILGSCVGTYAVFCLHGITMRIGFIVGALCWLTNNVLVGSMGTALLEATLILVNLVTIWKLRYRPGTTS